jgi:hypothetical protein
MNVRLSVIQKTESLRERTRLNYVAKHRVSIKKNNSGQQSSGNKDKVTKSPHLLLNYFLKCRRRGARTVMVL